MSSAVRGYNLNPYYSSALSPFSLAGASNDSTLAGYIQTFQSERKDYNYLDKPITDLLKSVTQYMRSSADPSAIKKEFLLQLEQTYIEQPLKEKMIRICDTLAGFDLQAETAYYYDSSYQRWNQDSGQSNAFEQILQSRLHPSPYFDVTLDVNLPPKPIQQLLESHRKKLEAGSLAPQASASAISRLEVEGRPTVRGIAPPLRAMSSIAGGPVFSGRAAGGVSFVSAIAPPLRVVPPARRYLPPLNGGESSKKCGIWGLLFVERSQAPSPQSSDS